MANETEVKYRYSLKQYRDVTPHDHTESSRERKGASRDTRVPPSRDGRGGTSRDDNVSSSSHRSTLVPNDPKSSTTSHRDDVISHDRLLSHQISRINSAASATNSTPKLKIPTGRAASKSAVSRSEKNEKSARAQNSPGQKVRAKTSVGEARRNPSLSEIFKQQQTIDVKGRPVSAPWSQNGEETKSVPSQEKSVRKGSAIPPANGRKSAKLSKRTDAPSMEKTKTPAVKPAKTPSGEKTEISPREKVKKSGKDLVQEKLMFQKKSETPFWFYRSKTDVLLKPTSSDEIKHDPSEIVSPRNTSSALSVRSPRMTAPHEDDVKLNLIEEESEVEKIRKPKSMIPRIYVYDSYHRKFISCGETPRSARTPREVTPKDVTPRQDPEEKEIVDLLRRNHRHPESPREVEVMRTLPLQSDLDKYVWWLESRKQRDASFTKSLNRYVPGFFFIEKENKKKVDSKSPTVTRLAPGSAVSEPAPVMSAFLTESNEQLAPVPQAPVLQGMTVDLNA